MMGLLSAPLCLLFLDSDFPVICRYAPVQEECIQEHEKRTGTEVQNTNVGAEQSDLRSEVCRWVYGYVVFVRLLASASEKLMWCARLFAHKLKKSCGRIQTKLWAGGFWVILKMMRFWAPENIPQMPHLEWSLLERHSWSLTFWN